MDSTFLFIFVTMVLAAGGDYELQVTIHSFRNPDGRCADVQCNSTTCCAERACPSPCIYLFSYCQRPAGTLVSAVRHIDQGNCTTSEITAPHRFKDVINSSESIFNATLMGTQWPLEGMQLYIEFQDNLLIDRFAINLTNPIGSESGTQTYLGIFGLVEIDTSFQLTCGYTGLDCTTVDVCTGVNCTFGTCVEGVGSCMCDPGYTGQFCEQQLDGYELLVTIHSFSNPFGRCADRVCSSTKCCEQTACPNRCEYYFSLCLRPAGTPVSTVRQINQGNCSTFDTIASRKISNGSNFNESVFGIPNPIILLWPTDGVQLHVEIKHSGLEELIDRFAIDIINSVHTTSGRVTYSGIFGLAEIDTTFRPECAKNFYGPSCDVFCLEHCHGDRCAGVDCGQNQRCVDEILNYTCVCAPGYTGPDCTTEFDVCTGVNCNFGTCVEGVGSCMCDPGYTGQFCEQQLDGYELLVTIHSFSNPSGRCADTVCSQYVCCNQTTCPNECEYVFSLCLKPAGSRVGEFSQTSRRGCNTSTVDTFASRIISNGSTFTDSVFGTPNPITLHDSKQWPAAGVQVYIELQHFKFADGAKLIDRFGIDIATPVADSTSGRHAYTGAFGLAEIEMSIIVVCDSGEVCDDATPDMRTSTDVTMPSSVGANNITVIYIVAAFVTAIFLLAVALLVIVCIFCGKSKTKTRFKSSQLVSYSQKNGVVSVVPDSQVLELNPNPTRINTDTVSDVPSLRNRVESIPNTYARLDELQADDHSRTSKNATAPTYSTTNPHCVTDDQSYATIDGENTCSKPTKNIYDAVASEIEAYDYTPRFNDYDYEGPYWEPAGKRTELLGQFEKLRILSAAEDALEKHECIGSGAFGTVYRGVWSHSEMGCDQVVQEEVAVKTMEDGASEEDRIKFLQEAAIMGQFDHPNIVKIMGIIVKNNECKIIMELMAKGNFRSHLPTLKASLTCQSDLASQLLYYSRQVASGMSYLSLRGYVHRDLAARNVLVSKDEICKIADFGLSRDLQQGDFYVSHGGMIPVKWTAPEALHYRLYSQHSDVWSYGCVLYEIWSLGVKPYDHLTNAQVMAKLSSGYRLPPPPGCPRAIYDIMIQCWNADSEMRPGFNKIYTLLNVPEFKVLKWSAADVARYTETSRSIGMPLAEGEALYTELQNTYMK